LLRGAIESVADPVARCVLQTQIDLFNQQNDQLEMFVDRKEKGFSVFGWLLKKFV
jgi:hypothetical protein